MTTVGKSYDGLTTRVLEPLTPDRVLSDALDSVLTDDKDRDGKRILAFSPDARLRSELQIRQHKLRAGLLVGRPADIALTVAQMLLGFGSARASQEDAEGGGHAICCRARAFASLGGADGLPAFRIWERDQDRVS
jgi:hypothetical protein